MGATPHIDAERRSGRTAGARKFDVPSSTDNWPASVGSEPALVASYDPEPELSRRKRPITDLTGLGLDSPPFVCFVYVLFNGDREG